MTFEELTESALITLRVGAPLALCDDNPAQARRIVQDTMRSFPEQPWWLQHYFAAMAEAEISLYEQDAEAATVNGAWKRSEEQGFFYAQFFLSTARLARVRAAMLAGRVSEAIRQLKPLLKTGEEWSRAVARVLQACVAASEGREREALAAMLLAADELEAIELGLYAAAARYRVAELRGDEAAQASVLRQLEERTVRAPRKLIDSLLPWKHDPHAH